MRTLVVSDVPITFSFGARPVLEVNVADVAPVGSYGTALTTKVYSQGQLVTYNGDTFHIGMLLE